MAFLNTDETLAQHCRYSGYGKLDITPGPNIRIMTLLPIDSGTDLAVQCNIEAVPLSQANPYFALSYVWGLPTDLAHIYIDGEEICVRRNLWDCLRNLRVLRGKIRLWVDYICINQRDVAERNAQVSLMAEIYEQADGVFAWLGEATTLSETAFEILDSASVQKTGRRRNATIERNKQGVFLADLINREYWDRLWIVQEAALAKELWIVAGQRMVNWDKLRALLNFHGRNGKFIASKARLSQHRLKTWEIVSDMRKDRAEKPLAELVSSLHNSKCQNPSDKLYGVLSLTIPIVRQKMAVDYAKTSLHIFIENLHLWEWADPGFTQQDSGIPIWYADVEGLGKLFLQLYGQQHLLVLQSDLSYWRSLSESERITSLSIPNHIVIYAESLLALTKYYTIAQIDLEQHTVRDYGLIDNESPLVPESSSRKACGFVSVVIITSDRLRSSGGMKMFVIYTDRLPKSGDLLLQLSSTCLLAHKTNNGVAIVGNGVLIDMENGSLPALLPSPVQWAERLLSHGKHNYQVTQWPQKLESFLVPDQPDTASFNVELDACAVADLIQNEIAFNTNLESFTSVSGTPLTEYSNLWTSHDWDFYAALYRHRLPIEIHQWRSIAVNDRGSHSQRKRLVKSSTTPTGETCHYGYAETKVHTAIR